MAAAMRTVQFRLGCAIGSMVTGGLLVAARFGVPLLFGHKVKKPL